MVDAITNAAVSGFNGAETRLAVAANTIVNAGTSGFIPSTVTQTQAAGGGVQTNVTQPPIPASQAQPQDTSQDQTSTTQTQQQIDQQQAADAEHAFLDTTIAVYDAKASIVVLRVQHNLNKQLFDIQA